MTRDDVTRAAETFKQAKHARACVASDNRSRRFRGLPTLPMPELPPEPVTFYAYDADGGYIGAVQAFTRDQAAEFMREDCEDAGIDPATIAKIQKS